jgi:phospholipid/cholesterol/gamma-HCH transport system substrate-binding protein
MTSFENISGLAVGAKVQLAGVDIGYVDSIRFSQQSDSKKVNVFLRLDKKYGPRIREDSDAMISTQGLLGDKYIFISIGSEDKPMLKDGDELVAKEGTSILDLAEKGGMILEDIGDAAKSIKSFMEGISGGGEDDDIKEMLKSARNIVEKAEKGEGLLHALIYEPNGKQIMNDMSESLRAIKGVLVTVDEDKNKKAKIAEIIDNLDSASQNVREITDKVARGEGTLGALVYDPEIYNDLRTLFGKASRSTLLKMIVRSNIKERENKILK